MKILITTGTFELGASGPSTYLSNLINRLVSRGHQIVLVTYKRGESQDSRQENDNFLIKRVPRYKFLPASLSAFVWQILILGRDCDLLFINDYGLPGTLANFILRKPSVMKIVGDFAWEYSIRNNLIDQTEDIDAFQKKKYGFKIRLLKKLQLFYARRARVIIAPSNYFKKVISGWGVAPEKIKVVYNAIDQKKYQIDLTPAEVRKKLGFKENDRLILTIARLAAWKGIDRVLEILPAIKKEIPEVKYLVAGQGYFLEKLKSLAKENNLEEAVIFLGLVRQEDIPLFLKAAEVLVLYSGYEGMSHVLLECLAASVPAVVSDKGGNPEAIEDGKTGILAPWGNSAKLQEAILRIMNNQFLAEEIKTKQREKTEFFNLEKQFKETINIFETLIQ